MSYKEFDGIDHRMNAEGFLVCFKCVRKRPRENFKRRVI
jgi:hypothetical protein